MKKTLKLNLFDATLNTDVVSASTNAELTIQLRIGFRQINPPGNADEGTYNDLGSPTGKPRKVIKWDAREWFTWKTNFVMTAQRFWHGRFWLLNKFGHLGFAVGRQVYAPNIWCCFELVGNDASAGFHHHLIDVVRLHPSEGYFGSHSTLYDSLDTLSVQKGIDSTGKPIMQRPHVHEIGHLLGLGHVDEGKSHCPVQGNTNALECYGVADADKYSVMGSGMELNLEHAAPWLVAMTKFLDVVPPSKVYPVGPMTSDPFEVSTQKVPPRLIK